MMRSLVLLAITLPALTTSMVAGLTAKASAEQEKFFCGQSQNLPTTMARTSKGPVPVIRWGATLGEDFPPEYRCKVVSEKFQTFYDKGMLNYLMAGFVNRQPVICVAQQEDGPCAGVLFTLRPNSDPTGTLRQLLSIRDRAPSIVLNEGASLTYINVQDFLDRVPVETDQPSIESESGSGALPTQTHLVPVNNGMW